jgi:formylglycine-generating enzyme required for sulfatase activity
LRLALPAALAALLAAGTYIGLRNRPRLETVAEGPDPPVSVAPTEGVTEAPPPAVAGMVYVPGGDVEAADGFVSPASLRRVYVAGFYLDRAEVSNAAYRAFCDAAGRQHPEPPDWDAGYFTGKPEYPVVNVSAPDAEAYARWAGKRLPTQEEWQRALAGEQGGVYPWGLEAEAAAANFAGPEDGHAQTAPGSGGQGLANLEGNVWEWTATALDGRRVVMGGSFATPGGGDLQQDLEAGARRLDVGFRCARDVE